MKTLQTHTSYTEESQQQHIEIPIQRQFDCNSNYFDNSGTKQSGSDNRWEAMLTLDRESIKLFGLNKQKLENQFHRKMTKEIFVKAEMEMMKSDVLTVTFATCEKKYKFKVEYTLISLSRAKNHIKTYKVVFILSQNREIKVFMSKEFVKFLLKILQQLKMKYYLNECSKVSESQMLANAIEKYCQVQELQGFALLCNYKGEEGFVLIKNGEEFIIVKDDYQFKRFSRQAVIKEGSYWVEIDDYWLSFINKGQKLTFIFEVSSCLWTKNIDSNLFKCESEERRPESERKVIQKQSLMMPMMRTQLKYSEKQFCVEQSTNEIKFSQDALKGIMKEQRGQGEISRKLNFDQQDEKPFEIKQEIDIENIEIEEQRKEINNYFSEKPAVLQQEIPPVQKDCKLKNMAYVSSDLVNEEKEELEEECLENQVENLNMKEQINQFQQHQPENQSQYCLLDILQISKFSLSTIEQDNRFHYYNANNHFFNKTSIPLSSQLRPCRLFPSVHDFNVNFQDNHLQQLFSYDLNKETVEKMCNYSSILQGELKDIKMLGPHTYAMISSSTIHTFDVRNALIEDHQNKQYKRQRYAFQKMDVYDNKIVIGQEDGKLKILDLRYLGKRSINNFDLRMDTINKGLYYKPKINETNAFQSLTIVPNSENIFCSYDHNAYIVESKSKNSQKSIFEKSIRYCDRNYIKKYPDELGFDTFDQEKKNNIPITYSINHDGSKIIQYTQRKAELINLKSKGIINPLLSQDLRESILCFMNFDKFSPDNLLCGFRLKDQIQFRYI